MKGAAPSQPFQAFPELDIEGVPVPVREPAVSKPAAPQQSAEAADEEIVESVRAAVAFGQKRLSLQEAYNQAMVAYQQPINGSFYQGNPLGQLGVALGGAYQRPKDDALFIPAEAIKSAGGSVLASFMACLKEYGLVMVGDFERQGYILRRR